jgi:dienelactone hydrolase
MSPLTAVPMSAAFRWASAAVFAASLAIGGQTLADELVSFPSLDGGLTGGAPTILRGVLLRPSGPGPFPAVVALHGCNGLFGKQGQLVAREAAWSETLTARGYVVLFPDSFGPRGVTSDCKGGPWPERVDDAYGALRYLQSQPFVIGERVGLIGWSHGGGAVAFAVAPTDNARPADLPKGDFRAAVAFYPSWCSLLGDNWTTAIPFLLELGASDDNTPPRPCDDRVHSALERGASAQIVVYAGAYHDFDWPGDTLHAVAGPSGTMVHYGENDAARADALTRVPAFLDAYLKP